MRHQWTSKGFQSHLIVNAVLLSSAWLAIHQLARADSPTTSFVDRLKKTGRIDHEREIQELLKLGPLAVQPLKEVLQVGNDPLARAGAAEALGRIGVEAADSNSLLIAILEDRATPDLGHLRRVAAEALGLIGLAGPHKDKVIPALVKVLKPEQREEESLKRVAAEALGRIGPDAGVEAAHALAVLLRDSAISLRCVAADALGKIGPSASDAVGELQGLLLDVQPAARRAAANSLRQIGWREQKITTALINVLKDSEQHWEVRRAAMDAIASIDPPIEAHEREVARDALIGLLDPGVPVNQLDPTGNGQLSSWIIRRSATNALKVIGPGPIDNNVISRLSLLIDWEPPERFEAVRVDNEARSEARRAAIDILARIGPEACIAGDPAQLIDLLIRALNDRSYWQVQRSAADALRAIIPGPRGNHRPLEIAKEASKKIAACQRYDRVIGAILEAVKQEQNQEQVLRSAADALGQLVHEDRISDAGDALLQLFKKSPSVHVRCSALDALWKINQASRIESKSLITLLDPGIEERLRHSAVDALAQVEFKYLNPEEARETIARLKSLLGKGERRDKSHIVRIAAADTLGKIGDRAQDAFGDLAWALQNDDHYVVRRSSADALARIVRSADGMGRTELTALAPEQINPIIEGLIQAIKDEDWAVQRSASEALGALGPKAAEKMIESLHGTESASLAVQEAFISALGKILGRIDPWSNETKGEIDPTYKNILKTLMHFLGDRSLETAAAEAIKSSTPRFLAKIKELSQTDCEKLRRLIDESLDSAGTRRGGPKLGAIEAMSNILSRLRTRQDELRNEPAGNFGRSSGQMFDQMSFGGILYNIFCLVAISLVVFLSARWFVKRRSDRPSSKDQGDPEGSRRDSGELVGFPPELPPSGFAKPVTMVPGAAALVSRYGAIPENAAEQPVKTEDLPPISAAECPAIPMRLLISYSHKDEVLREQFVAHLSSLLDEGTISGWHDRCIPAGADWDRAISEQLDSVGVILLLVSSDFLESRYIKDVEIKRAMERHKAGTARVIPVILRPCLWQAAPFGKLNALPRDGKAVTAWANRDEAFEAIVLGIRNTILGLTSATPSSPTLTQSTSVGA